jgi:hypothetical protein
VVPPGAEIDFHERVWRLPRCYYVNDKRRGLPRARATNCAGRSSLHGWRHCTRSRTRYCGFS